MSSSPPPRVSSLHENDNDDTIADTAVAREGRVCALLDQLAAAGLVFDPERPLPPEAVEQILITDPWTCRLCGRTDDRSCPETGRPHRRHLVRVAQRILRHLGAAPRPPRRGAGMSPQSLLLAHYYAVLPAAAEADAALRESACELLRLLDELRRGGGDEPLAAARLAAASAAWRAYSSLAARSVRPVDAALRQGAASTLTEAARTAHDAAAAELRRSPTNAALRAFVGALRDRLDRLAPSVSSTTSTTSTTLVRAALPPLEAPSDGGTSGSDAAPRPVGPPLPPEWYVDAAGRSRPPPTGPREAAARLEFRARKAYGAAVPLPVEPLRHRVEDDALLAQLAAQCNRRPPDLRAAPRLLDAVVEGLLGALPRRLRARVEQEVRDVLDWRIVRRAVLGSPANIAALMRYVMDRVVEFGAPARAEETRRAAEEMRVELEGCVPDLGTAVAKAFRLMLHAVRQLREDVARYSLLSITSQLRENAVEYIREFVVECLPPVAQWEKSLVFLRRYAADPRALRHAASPAAVSSTALSEGERTARAAVLFGTLDLLRSSGLQTADRWREYPLECLYFEKSIVFYAANTVQEGSLLLLLSGSISTVLRGRGIDSRAVNDLLKQLHDTFLRLLSGELTLPHLKTSVTNLVNGELMKINAAASLSEIEISQLHGTIDTMIDTTGSLYATFERRILQFIESNIVPGQADAAPLGLVTESLRRVTTILSHMLTFNWEVYQPFYKQMIPLILQTDGSLGS